MQQSSNYTGLVGHQRPSKLWIPEGLTSSAGPAAVALAEVAGLKLDPWQAWCVEQILGEKEELYWNEVLQRYVKKSAAYQAAIIVARQNGKGSILEACELAWLYLLGSRVIVHSAHEFATSREHFQRIEGLITNTPELKAELAPGGIKWSHGDESITLNKNVDEGRFMKSRLLFKTRTKSAARGFSIDKLVMDEAMILTDAGVKAMKNATSARPDPQIIMTGSAGDKDSVHFGRARMNGLRGRDPRLFYAEWSADMCGVMCPKDCTAHDRPDDPQVWAKTNPGLGYRIQAENVASDQKTDSPEAFAMERLSWGDWPSEEEAWAVIPEDAWMSGQDDFMKIVGNVTFGVYTDQDRKSSAIVACGAGSEGGTGVEVTGRNGLIDSRPGMSWVPDRVKEIAKRQRNTVFVIDQSSQAAQFIDELAKAGIRMLHPNQREYYVACGAFFSAVVPVGGSKPYLRHRNQPELTGSVAAVERAETGDLWQWDKKNASSDIAPIVAATLALWGHEKRVNKPKPKPQAFWG